MGGRQVTGSMLKLKDELSAFSKHMAYQTWVSFHAFLVRAIVESHYSSSISCQPNCGVGGAGVFQDKYSRASTTSFRIYIANVRIVTFNLSAWTVQYISSHYDPSHSLGPAFSWLLTEPVGFVRLHENRKMICLEFLAVPGCVKSSICKRENIINDSERDKTLEGILDRVA